MDSMANNAVHQNGSAASELAADAYHCIMVWAFGPAEYKDVAQILCAPPPAAPLDFVIPTITSVPRARSRQGQGLSVAANAGQPLTAPARAGNSRCVGRGEETGFQVEQRN
jgi:hypothetical protein